MYVSKFSYNAVKAIMFFSSKANTKFTIDNDGGKLVNCFSANTLFSSTFFDL